MEEKGKKSDVRLKLLLVFIVAYPIAVYLLLSFRDGTHVSISKKEMVHIREELIRYENEKLWEFFLNPDDEPPIKEEPLEYDDMLIYRYKDGSYLVTNESDGALLFASYSDTNPTEIPKGMDQALKENFISFFLAMVEALVLYWWVKKEYKRTPKDADEEKRGMEFHEIKKELEKKKKDGISGNEENVGKEKEEP